jgi:hypothetical protein
MLNIAARILRMSQPMTQWRGNLVVSLPIVVGIIGAVWIRRAATTDAIE